jgi:hypothetical protein
MCCADLCVTSTSKTPGPGSFGKGPPQESEGSPFVFDYTDRNNLARLRGVGG